MKLGIVLLAMCMFVAYGKEPVAKSRIDSILVSVNGRAISLMDVVYESRQEEAKLGLVYQGRELYEAVKKLRMRILNEIIKRYLILDDYRKNPYEIPTQLVESMLDDLAENFGCTSRSELAVKAKQSGTTIEELRFKARERLIIQSMINTYCHRHVTVTPREIYEYYEQHKDQFSTPARIKLAVISLKSGRADYDKLRQDIAKGLKEDPTKFAAYAQLYTDVAADKGGDLGWIEEKGLRKEFKDVLKDMKTGDTSPEIVTKEGCYFIQLTGEEPETVQDFKVAGVKLYREVEARMRDEAVENYVEELKKDAIIRYGQ